MTEASADDRDADPAPAPGGRALVTFLWRGYRTESMRLLGAIMIASAAQCILLFAIAYGIGYVQDSALLIHHSVMMIALIAKVIGSKIWCGILTARLADTVSQDLLRRLTRRIANTNLGAVEGVGRGRLLSALTSDVQTVISGVRALSVVLQAALLGIFCLFVMLGVAFVPTVAIGGYMYVTVRAVRPFEKAIDEGSGRALSIEDKLSERVTTLRRAAKDLRINSNRRAAYGRRGLQPALRAASRIREKVGDLMRAHINFVRITNFAMIFAVVLFLPQFTAVAESIIVIAVLFYLLERTEFLFGDGPVVTFGGAALLRLSALEDRLPPDPSPPAEPLTTFRRLTLSDVVFTYPGGHFGVGPINLEIEAGQICFIRGGNGAGKSTILRLICGLYDPAGGRVLIDGTVRPAEAQRSLFATVFTNFHLFERLHGLRPDQGDAVRDWLDRLSIAHVVGFDGRRFTARDLSTGQRKRLALIAAIMEERPILLLDEWTADQSPEFRHLFFTELLPDLRAQGFTVIAVTHDDRYFDYCDCCIRIESGQVVAIDRPGSEEA